MTTPSNIPPTDAPERAGRRADESGTSEQSTIGRRRPRMSRGARGSLLLTVLLALCSLTVIVPLYVTFAMAFKTTEQSVDGNAF